MKKEQIIAKLLENGVRNLKEFGYPNVNLDNILTDDVYKEFFKSMLNDNLGHNQPFDEAINELLTKIK